MKRAIAITAMSGLFPGTDGPVGVEGFWNNIQAARPAKLHSLENKWGLRREEYFDPRPGTPYRTYLDAAYVIGERGASLQVEIGKQVIRELFDSVRGTALPDAARIALSVGTLWSDASYFADDARRVVGNSAAISAELTGAGAIGPDAQLSAISEAAGISGPALAIDTACASSLYALDTAIGLIEQERADAVAVMGLNGFLPPFMYFGFSKLMALSTSGQILPFSSDACGIIPSEAIAAVLVEPVEQAVRCGRPVLAVVRGLGLSADGGDRSVFAPSPRGQELAYERAYRGVDPRSVAYVEAHGTATVLGDATEIQTLDRFFAPYREEPIPIGSVKALIGHSIGSAGLSSLIKAICMIRDGVIPPHIQVQPNPKLRATCLRLPAAAEPWPQGKSPRRVGISSFGLGGANSHLVIGSFEEDTDLRASTALRPRKNSANIAILGLEATMAAAHGSTEVAALLDRAEPGATGFPWQRFFPQQAPNNGRTVSGNFFPSQLLVEAQGLRMGPKALGRVDPFQRLGVHAVKRTLAAEAGSATSLEDVAVAFCSNLGGEGALQISRNYLAHMSGKAQQDRRWARVEPSVESIASALSSLCSGFVAFHLGLKGFHETVSGDSSTFWETLTLAPYWLDAKCRSLVIAAGRQIKSPVDLDHATAPGEGVAAFLLQSEQEARSNGRQPLAVIRDIVPCGEHGLDRSTVDLYEISQLDETGSLGTAQQRCGFLAEATGVESLLRVLLTPGIGWRAIEIRRGERPVAHVLIEKLRDWEAKAEAAVTPIPIEFQPSTPVAKTETAGMGVTTFLEWQASTEAAILAYLQSQAQLLAMRGIIAGPPAAFTRPLHLLRRNDKNIVIEAPKLETGSASALLRVDEAHPYFFDHHLDHVPGILIMEGMLQLTELLMPEGHFIRSIDLNFRRFCEKTDPAVIHAERVRNGGINSYSMKVLQNGFDVSRCEVETTPATPVTDQRYPSFPRVAKAIADPGYLHKLRPENVLVTELEEVVPDEVCASDLLPPPSGHILSEGDAGSHSLLYLLEAARQFAMLIGHQVEKIPVGMPMNLVSVRVRLDEPVPRDRPLRFLCPRQPVQRIGRMTIATINLELHAPHGKIGEAGIKAQVVDLETYAKQRGLVASVRSDV